MPFLANGQIVLYVVCMDGLTEVSRQAPARAARNHSVPQRSDVMSTVPHAPKLLLVLLASASSLLAQQAAPTPATADTSSIILAHKAGAPVLAPSAHAADSAPASSPEINAAISSGVPAYNREEPSSKADALAKDQREVDKPKNDIPRLPLSLMSRYVVRGARLPVFRNVDLYTKQGLIDLSFKDHPGLRVGNFFNLNSGLALEAALKDQRTADRMDLTDTAFAMAVGGDSSEAEVLQNSIIDESFKAGTQEGPVATGPDPR
jgi:hypothetical protein